MSEDILTQLAGFAADTSYKDIPPDVREFTKGLILKTVAGMAVGSQKPAGRQMADLMKSHGSAPEVRVIGSGFRTSMWEAVLLDAFFAHASELEDDRFNGGVSWDITVIPLLAPLGEKLSLSGEDFLTAVILGLEVTTRTCLFVNPPMEVGHVPGSVGPAAGAARAMGLGVKETLGAMSLALSGFSMAHVNLGTHAHFLESAMMSLHGIIAADMARAGMSGSTNISRYLKRFWGREFVEPGKMVADLGKKWLLTETWVKKYPCCFATHRQIDALIELRTEHNISPEQVEVVEVHSGLGDKIVDRPEPGTEEDLLFSLQHVLAAALLDGDVNLPHLVPEAISDSRYVPLRDKIKVIYHPEWERKVVGAPARIVIRTKDGRELARERLYPIGSPHEPLTMPQFRALYAKFLQGILPERAIAKTADQIMGIEKLADVKELFSAF